MNFTKVYFNDVALRVPVLENGKPWDDWGGSTVDTYPNYCGAGDGFGDKIVPDEVWGLRIAVACHIHDVSWELAPATEEARDLCDRILLTNLLAIIEARSSCFTRWLRNYRAMTYFNAVNDNANHLFWALKRTQGLSGTPLPSAKTTGE